MQIIKLHGKMYYLSDQNKGELALLAGAIRESFMEELMSGLSLRACTRFQLAEETVKEEHGTS